MRSTLGTGFVDRFSEMLGLIYVSVIPWSSSYCDQMEADGISGFMESEWHGLFKPS